MAASLSRIRDVDIASEAANLARGQARSQAGAAVLSHANQSPQLALALLRGWREARGRPAAPAGV